jgi:hypothetical protein
MNTVLLWGNAWWLDDRPEPLPFADLSDAADVLAEHFAQNRGTRPLRLIYQPDSLETVASACPKGGRATLAAALADELPALGDAEHAWGHEPILPQGGGFTTLVHFEREPGLFALVAQLEARRFTVESVWPLGTFLHALPDEWSESGATTVVAVEPVRACAYRHATNGRREILTWHGEQAIAEVGHWLTAIFEKEANEPVLLVAEADEAAALDAGVSLTDKPGVQLVSFREALRRRAVLPRHHPAQLVRPAPLVTAQRAVIVASLAFLAFAGWSGAGYARDAFAWRTEGATREAQKQTLRAEVTHLRANAAEIAALRATLAGFSPNPPGGELLEKISATLPPEIALATLHVGAGRFTLHGHVAPSAPAGALDGWRTKFADSRWTLEIPAAPAPDGAFTVEGKFTS